jgi:hypothetical protein
VRSGCEPCDFCFLGKPFPWACLRKKNQELRPRASNGQQQPTSQQGRRWRKWSPSINTPRQRIGSGGDHCVLRHDNQPRDRATAAGEKRREGAMADERGQRWWTRGDESGGKKRWPAWRQTRGDDRGSVRKNVNFLNCPRTNSELSNPLL